MKKIYECSDGAIRTDIWLSDARITGRFPNFKAAMTKAELKQLIDKARAEAAEREQRQAEEKLKNAQALAAKIASMNNDDLKAEYYRLQDAMMSNEHLMPEMTKRGLLRRPVLSTNRDAIREALMAQRAAREGWSDEYEDGLSI